MQKIVCLEFRRMLTVGKALEHCCGIEIPDVGSAHDPKTERTKDGKIHGSIHLLHETCNLSLSPNVTVKRPWPDHSLHQEFTGERENHGVKSDKCKILLSFAVHHRFARIFRFAGVGQEKRGVQWICFGGIYRVCGEEGCQDNQRYKPGVPKGYIFEPTKQRSRLSTFVMRFSGFSRNGSL